MQIGEFALLCNTRISVLRHYDSEGLLKPDYIDNFTGYRYYSKEQAEDFFRITSLKEAGFSLADIKAILAENEPSERIEALFYEKREKLKKALSKLDEVRRIYASQGAERDVRLTESNGVVTASTSCPDPESFDGKCDEIELWLFEKGYQRISYFELLCDNGGYRVSCNVLKLAESVAPVFEDCDIGFEDDPSVVGKWQVVGEFAVREDFFTGRGFNNTGEGTDRGIICFLPGGVKYWSFGWTKGFLIIENGLGRRCLNRYAIELVGNQRYMFVEHKSYNYCRGGKETVLVLRQLDNISYSKRQIALKDEINLPFINDPEIIGKWCAVDFVTDKDAFCPDKDSKLPLFYESVEFYENGNMKSTFANEGVIESRNIQTWTAGYVLEKVDSCACAYEIRKLNKKEYLFLEWKSGDYVYGHMLPKYYVFIKEA